MSHYTTRLPREIEVGAVRHLEYSTSVVKTDGGFEVRNARWSAPLRKYEISIPAARRDNAAYLAVLALYTQTRGGADSFELADFSDPTGNTIIPVRFDGAISVTGIDYRTDHIETFNLVEVR